MGAPPYDPRAGCACSNVPHGCRASRARTGSGLSRWRRLSHTLRAVPDWTVTAAILVYLSGGIVLAVLVARDIVKRKEHLRPWAYGYFLALALVVLCRFAEGPGRVYEVVGRFVCFALFLPIALAGAVAVIVAGWGGIGLIGAATVALVKRLSRGR